MVQEDGTRVHGQQAAGAPYRLSDIDWTVWTPRDQATLVFIIQPPNILLIRKKRGLGQGKINGPGGKMEAGETPQACALREVEEELAICPQALRLHGQLEFQFTDGYSIRVHVYTADRFEGEPVETDEAQPLWYALDAIPYQEMWVDDALWMPLMLAGRRFFGRFVLDQDRLLDQHIEDLGTLAG
ncbi:MAG: 8-oxo-dGTP diphosphatase [Kistimonas sp.]|nr:8-oxo-dGTP diphosphatase [Kistimonas sp.]